jgi:hypothetical protein
VNTPRKVSDEEIKKYIPMVDSYIRNNILKNWREASMSKERQEVPLGNTGWTVRDIRQYLLAEVFIALTKYKPDFRTAEGRGVMESTFVYGHILKRGGSMAKRLTKAGRGYGCWSIQLEKALKEFHEEEV